MSDDVDAKILCKKPIAFAPPWAGMESFFQLEHWRVRVGNREDDRIVWKRGDFVIVVAITDSGNVVLNREYKQAVEQTLLCLPTGGKKKDETPKAAAIRELREESGYTSSTENHCHVFGPFFNSPDKSTERHYVVVVLGAVSEGSPTPDESETILGTQLCPVDKTKDKLMIGLHRMAMDIASEFLAKR